jgi:hypothetical protein
MTQGAKTTWQYCQQKRTRRSQATMCMSPARNHYSWRPERVRFVYNYGLTAISPNNQHRGGITVNQHRLRALTAITTERSAPRGHHRQSAPWHHFSPEPVVGVAMTGGGSIVGAAGLVGAGGELTTTVEVSTRTFFATFVARSPKRLRNVACPVVAFATTRDASFSLLIQLAPTIAKDHSLRVVFS